MEQATTSKAKAWGRVWPAIRPPHSRNLRAGAWYPIVNDELPDRVTLEIGSSTFDVPRRVLEIRPRKPTRFSVVHRVDYDYSSRRKSVHKLGRFYAVCPACDERFALFGKPEQVECKFCNHKGDVAWWETA